MSKLHTCIGCGSTLQTVDANKKGYTIEKHLERRFCQRCYKIKHYGQFQQIDISNQELFDQVQTLTMENQRLILILDITDIEGSFPMALLPLLKNYQLIVCVNKLDLINLNAHRFDHWTKHIETFFEKHSLVLAGLFYVSAQSGEGIGDLINLFEQVDENDRLYLIGTANVGKSSLIQSFGRLVETESQLPVVFHAPGTTLAQLEIPFDHYFLVDMPGIMQPLQMTYHVLPEMLKSISFTDTIRPINYTIYEPQDYFIGGFVQVSLDNIEETNSVTFYLNQFLSVHRRKNDGNWQAFLDKHRGELLTPPTRKQLEMLPQLAEWEEHSFTIDKEKIDIVISGLGWLSIKKPGVSVTVRTTKDVHVYKKDALI